MIRIKDKEIHIKKDEAEKTKAYGKPDTTYAPEIMKFKVKEASGKFWRLVHDGVTVLALIEGTDDSVTECIHDIFEFDTELLALAEIDRLGLVPLPTSL